MSFNLNEPGIKIDECVKANQDVVAPNGKIIPAGKIGLIIEKVNDKDVIAIFDEGTDDETKVYIKRTWWNANVDKTKTHP